MTFNDPISVDSIDVLPLSSTLCSVTIRRKSQPTRNLFQFAFTLPDSGSAWHWGTPEHLAMIVIPPGDSLICEARDVDGNPVAVDMHWTALTKDGTRVNSHPEPR